VKNFEGKEADIILNGHIDVVPISEDGQFDPKEIDGKIYARGSGDMKA
jgi:acetylornithine deacetylase/succinyl-diaminopimelate desuccinylase-like protein